MAPSSAVSTAPVAPRAPSRPGRVHDDSVSRDLGDVPTTTLISMGPSIARGLRRLSLGTVYMQTQRRGSLCDRGARRAGRRAVKDSANQPWAVSVEFSRDPATSALSCSPSARNYS